VTKYKLNNTVVSLLVLEYTVQIFLSILKNFPKFWRIMEAGFLRLDIILSMYSKVS